MSNAHITALMAAIVQDLKEESNEGSPITRMLLTAADGEAYLNAESALLCFPERSAVIEALRIDAQDRRISAVLDSVRWSEVLAPEVQAMQVTDGCGADCFALILRAEWLLAQMADVDARTAHHIRQAVGEQCGVFYFG